MESLHPFTLPGGYADAQGKVHREGLMRRARAGDEIGSLEDPRVKGNRAYLVILVLSRVIVRLGDLEGEQITPALIEGLYSGDLAYLQSFYLKLNGLEEAREVSCPFCRRSFRPQGPQGAP